MVPSLTSFWLHSENPSLARICYLSPTCWEETLLADIDLMAREVRLIQSLDEQNKHRISQFILSIEAGTCAFRQLELSGNDLTIIREAHTIVEEQGNPFRVLNIHILAALDGNYHYRDASHLLLDTIKKEIDEIYRQKSEGNSKKDFYCGTTHDLDLRMEQHRHRDFGIAGNSVYAWNCATVSGASQIREWAATEGYDTGVAKNSVYAAKNATLVYFLKKEKEE